MKVNNNVVIPVLMVATLLSGCGGGDENGGANNTTELEGVWVGICDAVSGFVQSTTTVSGNTWSDRSIFYTDSACSIPVAGEKPRTNSGTFIIGSAITTSSGWSAKEIDLIGLKKNGVEVKTKTTAYEIFSITNGKLYLGTVTPEKDGSSAAKRPVDLNFTRPAIKN
ncbi:MAG TPA: hypothetical protein ENI98_12710 [Gammaproteobacteria bacterium]|nr:hypothetical protein [Gammaproteobacteria bacterium]